MSSLWVLAPSTGVIALSLAVTRVHHRLPAKQAAWLCLGALIVPVLTLLPVLVHFSIAAVVSVPRLGPFVHDIAHTNGVHTQPGWHVGIVGLILLATALIRSSLLLIEFSRLSRPMSGQIDIIDDQAAYAYARPGKWSGIAISDGALDILSPGELRAVLAHEKCHKRYRHDIFTLIGMNCVTFIPILRSVSSRLEYSLERWSDDVAVQKCGSRTVVASAILKMVTGLPLSHFAHGVSRVGIAARLRLLTTNPTTVNSNNMGTLAMSNVVIIGLLLLGLQWREVLLEVLTVCGS